MPTELLLVGAGGHGKVVYDALRLSAADTDVKLCDADEALGATEFFDLSVHAPLDWNDPLPHWVHVSIGDNGARLKVAEKALSRGFELHSINHPGAAVAASARLGAGAFVAAASVVGPAAELGSLAIVNHGAVVDHDCRLGVAVHVAPNATLGGGVVVADGSLIGAGAVVLPGIEIGARAVVGAGAVVVDHVPADTTVVGVPAKQVGNGLG